MENFWRLPELVTLALVIVIAVSGLLSRMGKLRRVKVGKDGIEAEADGPPRGGESLDSVYGELRALRLDLDNIRGLFDSTNQDISNLSESIRSVKIDQQKQIFYDRDQRPSERLAAGLRYVFYGQNGEVKADVKAFALERREAYEAIVTLKPEWKMDLRG